MDNLDIKKLLNDLEAPFSSPDSAVYCLCESCQFLQEVPLDFFYELCAMEAFGKLDHLNDPLKFRQKYYLTVDCCVRCPGGIKNQEVELTVKVREISGLRYLLEKGVSFVQRRLDSLFGFCPN